MQPFKDGTDARQYRMKLRQHFMEESRKIGRPEDREEASAFFEELLHSISLVLNTCVEKDKRPEVFNSLISKLELKIKTLDIEIENEIENANRTN